MTRTVLIVDDDATIREIMSLTLTHVAGYDVMEAADGAAGVRAALQQQPDAVLLDVMMPGVDGPTVLERLRADDRTAHVPVIFLTAKMLPAERERLKRLGAAGVIAKPFDALELVADVRRLLSW